MSDHWLAQSSNRRFVEELRQEIGKGDPQVLVFLGAGLSIAANLYTGDKEGDIPRKEEESLGEGGDADHPHHRYYGEGRFPTWTQLVERMKDRLLDAAVAGSDTDSLWEFFSEQSPLDCAQLFRQLMGDVAYFDFLRRQYGTDGFDDWDVTEAHRALAEMPLRLLFTTNYDGIIEDAYRRRGKRIEVSHSAGEYDDDRDSAMRTGAVHLVKLHGTIEHPETIVLTRTDYCKARHERGKMLTHLLDKFKHASFLFVGFSLSDPNINLILDDARYERKQQLPVSYVVQSGRDRIRDLYLQSLGVNTIALDSWGNLAEFLRAINPSPILLTT